MQLDIPFQQVGVLYDQVMPTGTRRAAELAAKAAGVSLQSNASKLEEEASSGYGRPTPIFGDGEKEQEGAMLFLVREMSHDQSRETDERYLARGFRMTEPRFLGGHLARHYAVSKKDMDSWLSNLKMYAKRGTRPVVQPGGVYVGLFGVRASTTRLGGLETLVYGFARHQVPAYRLPKVECVTPQIRHFVRCLDRMTLEEAQATCRQQAKLASERLKSLSAVRSSREQSRARADADEEQEIMDETDVLDHISSFQMSLCVALDALENSVRFYPQLRSSARLSADILEVPSSLDDSTAPAEVILVQAVLPDDRTVSNSSQIDASQVIPTDQPHPDTPFVFTPYTLFSKSQMMLLKGRQADLFEQEVLWELKCRYSEVDAANAPALDDKLDFEKGSMSPFSASSPKAAFAESDGADSARGFTTKIRSLMPASPRRRSSLMAGTKQMPLFDVEMQSPTKAVRSASISDGINAGKLQDWVTVRKLNRDDPPAQTSVSLSSAASEASASLGTSPVSTHETLAGNYNPGAAAQSLGIRRFTQPGLGDSATYGRTAELGSPARLVSKRASALQGERSFLNVQPSRPATASNVDALEVIVSSPDMAQTDSGAVRNNARQMSQLRTPPRQQTGRRPSTAQPVGTESRSDSMVGAGTVAAIQRVRPRTADVESRPTGLSLSQRRMTASGSKANPRSITARTRSDDWMGRHLTAIERGPGGQGLLGVDY